MRVIKDHGTAKCPHTTIIWLRNDLRLADHQGFTLASKLAGNQALLPVFILSPTLTGTCPLSGIPRCGPHRAKFLLETLRDLQTQLQALSSDILVCRGKSEEVIPTLFKNLSGAGVVVGMSPVMRSKTNLRW